MTRNGIFLVAVGLVLILGCLFLATSRSPVHDPKDLTHWMAMAASQDWSQAARNGNAEAQFFMGLNLVRSNVVTMVDRVPTLARIPIIGRRLFERRSYALDNNLSPDQSAGAYHWIRQSADQGFGPAKEAIKLFPRIPAITGADPNLNGDTNSGERGARSGDL